MRTQADARLAAALAVSVAALAWAAQAAACGQSPAAGADAVRARELLALVNAHRSARGLRPVATAPSLRRAARWKARHMALHAYMAHSDAHLRRSLAQRLQACGYSQNGWGEVLAAGYARPRAVLRAWLASPRHRRIIELRSWRSAGVGTALSFRGVRYWAVDFGM